MKQGFIHSELQTDPLKERVWCDIKHKTDRKEHGILVVELFDEGGYELSLCRQCWKRLALIAADMAATPLKEEA